MDKNIFKQVVSKCKEKDNPYKDGFISFISGGIMGILSQGLIDLYHLAFKLEIELAFSLSSITLVFIASVLTMIGFYNNIGQIFGAGLFIPITGFSNSMVSASMEGKSEGLVYGIGARTFSLAGSVIIYGVVSGIILSFGYYLLYLMGVVS